MLLTREDRKKIRQLTDQLVETHRQIEMVYNMSGSNSPQSDYLEDLERHESSLIIQITELKRLHQPSMN